MSTPLLVLIGHCTSKSAKLLAVFDSSAGPRARIEFRISGQNNSDSLETPLVAAEPFLIASFELKNLPEQAEGTRIQYSIRSTSDPSAAFDSTTPAFKLMPSGRPLRFAVVSCNGAYRMSDEKRRYRLWRTVQELSDGGNIDMILHVGDQIYADAIRMRYAINQKDQKLQPGESKEFQALVSEYRKTYVETWRPSEVSRVLATTPSIMMWDDHEIFDGYGSHDEDSSPASQAFFQAAQKAFMEFQAANNPDPLSGSSHACAFVHRGSGFLILDDRTNRSFMQGVVLGKGQLAEAQRWLTSNVGKLQQLYVVTAIPIVHVPVVGYLNFAHLIGWKGGIVEDLRDSWVAPNNQHECKDLLSVLFDFLAKSPGCHVTILCGDAHVGTIGEIQSTNAVHRRDQHHLPVINQVVSSGIGSPPPPGLAGLILRLAAGDRMELAAPHFQGSLLPLPGRDSEILARRNFAVIHEESKGFVVTFYVEEGDQIVQISKRLGA